MKFQKTLWLGLLGLTTWGAPLHADASVEPTLLDLNGEERQLVLSEMREFLATVSLVMDAIAVEDMEAVAQAAQKMGQQTAGAMPATLAVKLPVEFKQLARQAHGGFDEIARDARDLGDKEHSYAQLGGVLKTCVSCHSAFRLR